MGDTSRVEDDVWIRAIMEKTFDDVEGHEEIFPAISESLLHLFAKMDRDPNWQKSLKNRLGKGRVVEDHRRRISSIARDNKFLFKIVTRRLYNRIWHGFCLYVSCLIFIRSLIGINQLNKWHERLN